MAYKSVFIVVFLICLMGAVFSTPSLAFSPDFAACLQQNECHQCNSDPDHQNDHGYLGFYQMGVNYASEAVCSNPGSIPRMNLTQNWNTFTNICIPNQWALDNGLVTQNSDGSYNHVWMQGGNPQNVNVARQMQTAMLMQNSAAHWNWIQNNLSQYIGQTINGIEMTQETMVAMAHLLGRGGLRDTLEGGNVTDGNGTSGWHYAGCLQGCLQNNGVKGECKFTVNNICRGNRTSSTSDTDSELDSGAPADGDTDGGRTGP